MATKNEIDNSTGYNEEANNVLESVPFQERLGEFDHLIYGYSSCTPGKGC